MFHWINSLRSGGVLNHQHCVASYSDALGAPRKLLRLTIFYIQVIPFWTREHAVEDYFSRRDNFVFQISMKDRKNRFICLRVLIFLCLGVEGTESITGILAIPVPRDRNLQEDIDDAHH